MDKLKRAARDFLMRFDHRLGQLACKIRVATLAKARTGSSEISEARRAPWRTWQRDQRPAERRVAPPRAGRDSVKAADLRCTRMSADLRS